MGGYKEHKLFDMFKRKSVIIKYSIIIVLIFMVTAILIIQTLKDIKTKSIIYTENSDVAYKVYLKDNNFFEKEYLEANNQYIANLIDFIEADFKYDLMASEKNINYKYTYKIVAEVNVKDKANSNVLYKYTEDLVNEKEYEANTNTILKITQPIKIDYNKYNDIINEFVKLYDLDNSNASVTVNMYVDILNDKKVDEEKKDIPVVSLNMPLTTKTIAIDIEANAVNENNVKSNNKMNKGKCFLALVLAIVDIYLAIKLVMFIQNTKDEEAVYKMIVGKILSNYGSYIQKISKDFDFTGYQSVELKNFEDLLQIREIVQEPILMLNGINEAHFMVPTNGKIVYIYEVCQGNKKKRIVGRKEPNTEMEDYEMKI